MSLVNPDEAGAYYRPFVVKYDPTGRAVWARSAREAGPGFYLHDAIMDASGNCYVAGCYDTPFVCINNSTTIWPTNSLSQSPDAMFVVEYDSNGEVVWARNIWGESRIMLGDLGPGIGLDAFGNVYLAGGFAQTQDFDGITLTSAGDLDAFLTKLSGPPRLGVMPGPAWVVLSWPTNQSGFFLESLSSLTSGNWTPVEALPTVAGGSNVLVSQFLGSSRFFRLRKQY